MLFKKLHGVRVKHLKNTANVFPQRIALPKTVYIPMTMHIGAPAHIIVKAGDTVNVGTLIGESGTAQRGGPSLDLGRSRGLLRGESPPR